jgi:hypothetical protein
VVRIYIKLRTAQQLIHLLLAAAPNGSDPTELCGTLTHIYVFRSVSSFHLNDVPHDDDPYII